MPQFRELPPLEELEKFFAYDPGTGIVSNRIDRGIAKAGNPAGTIKKGYLYISYKGNDWAAHRIAWALHHGADPGTDVLIDHDDRNRSNNRINNLVAADYSRNGINSVATGVFKDRNSYRARISVNGKARYFGRYKTREEAVEACKKARHQLIRPHSQQDI